MSGSTAAKRKYAEAYTDARLTRSIKRMRGYPTPQSRKNYNAKMGGFYVPKATGGETKAVDVICPAALPLAAPYNRPWNLIKAGTMTLLNQVSPGSGAWQRQGRLINMKSLYIRGAFFSSGSNITQDGLYARCIVFYDKQPNGAYPNQTDLLNDQLNSAIDLTQNTPLSGINLNNRSRFEIIIDREWMLPSNSKSGSQPNNYAGQIVGMNDMRFTLFRKLNMRQTEFKGQATPATIADIATGSLCMLWIGGSDDAGNNSWNVQMACRLKYVDG